MMAYSRSKFRKRLLKRIHVKFREHPERFNLIEEQPVGRWLFDLLEKGSCRLVSEPEAGKCDCGRVRNIGIAV